MIHLGRLLDFGVKIPFLYSAITTNPFSLSKKSASSQNGNTATRSSKRLEKQLKTSSAKISCPPLRTRWSELTLSADRIPRRTFSGTCTVFP